MERSDEEFNRRLAEEVRVEAARQGINSQSELGRRSGMPQTTIRRYFYSDEREIPLSALRAVARGLGVTAPDLLRRAEGPSPSPVARELGAGVKVATARAVNRPKTDTSQSTVNPPLRTD